MNETVFDKLLSIRNSKYVIREKLYKMVGVGDNANLAELAEAIDGIDVFRKINFSVRPGEKHEIPAGHYNWTCSIEGVGQSLDSFVDNTLTYYKNDTVIDMGRDYIFQNCSLIEVVFPNLTSIRNYTFQSCKNLLSVNVPKIEYIGAYTFYSCSSIESLILPCVSAIYTNSCKSCSALKIVDIGVTVDICRTEAFSGCRALNTLILRGSELSILSNVNNFNNTPLAKGNGTIYVPASLIEDYKTATNWNVLYEAGCSFVAIEGSDYE